MQILNTFAYADLGYLTAVRISVDELSSGRHNYLHYDASSIIATRMAT